MAEAERPRVTRSLGRFWTAANMLSLSRAALVPPITVLVYQGGPRTWLFGLIGLAVLTDWFDGHLARWSHTVSEWGKVLDPLADKLAAAAVTAALVVRPIEPTLPLWFVGLIVARDASIVLGGVVIARRTGEVLMSIWWGKVAVSALSVTVLATLLEADAPVLQACVWITTALMVYTYALYLLRFVRVWRTGVLPSEVGMDGEGGRAIASVHPETS
ncbi:MAG: CDP-alcohol phosphatidyltransferase family protein [Rhodothermales bacterium]|nr:CDP-alcohol phosphatidyltransferase family protein [Rhodothermales bacterium]